MKKLMTLSVALIICASVLSACAANSDTPPVHTAQTTTSGTSKLEPSVTTGVSASESDVTTNTAPFTTTTTPITTTSAPVTTTTKPFTTTAPVTTTTPVTTTAPVTTTPPVPEEPHTTHSFGSWKTTTKATCTADGKQTRSCSCGAVETRTVDATGHSFGNWQTTKPATCENDGTQTRVCSACGKTEKQTVPAEHPFKEWRIYPATCTTNGLRRRSCSQCFYSEEEYPPATGHAWDSGVTNATPTLCSTVGTITYTCTTCGVTKVEHINATHSYSDWQWEVSSYIRMSFNGITDQHIPTETHLKFRVCDTCGHKEYAELPNHPCYERALNIGSFTRSVTREATCSVPELTRYTCNVCGWYFEYESSTSEHTWGEEQFFHLTDYTDVTDEMDAYITACTVCGYQFGRYVIGQGSENYNLKTKYRISHSTYAFPFGDKLVEQTSYRIDPGPNDFVLTEHPEWRTIYRNVVYDAEGYAIQYDVIWWDTGLNKRCSETVVVEDIPKKFEENGWDLSEYDINRIAFHIVPFYGKLITPRVSWSG